MANAAPATPATPAPGAWAPLGQPTFRALWLAILAGNIGTWWHNFTGGHQVWETTDENYTIDKRMQELMSGGTTVLFVSHSIEQIERMCNKVAWLSHGRIKMNGDTATVCEAYKQAHRGEA